MQTPIGCVILTVQSIRINTLLVILVVITPPVTRCVVQVVEWLIPEGLPLEKVFLLRVFPLLQALITTPCLANFALLRGLLTINPLAGPIRQATPLPNNPRTLGPRTLETICGTSTLTTL